MAVPDEASGGGVESPQVAAEAVDVAGAASAGRPQRGGWRGRGAGCATAGRPPDADRDQQGANQDHEAADWEWAREQARKAPRWTDDEWREINAALGYQVTDKRRLKKRAAPGDNRPGSRDAGAG